MAIPKKYQNYNCSEYFESEVYRNGVFNLECQLYVVYPEKEVNINHEEKHMAIGSSGADGIEFCYRENKDDIWAYYPIENEYEKVSSSLNELIEGWSSGDISI